jgi:hypothetical protein
MDQHSAIQPSSRAPSVVNQVEGALQNVRRALRRKDQHLFDALFAGAGKYSAQLQLADHATPLEATLLTMLIEVEKNNKAMNDRLDILEVEYKRLHKMVYQDGPLWP